MACDNTCTVVVREQEVLFSEVTGPVTKPGGEICYTHISGNPDIAPTEISIPPSAVSDFNLECVQGCITFVHDNGDGDEYRRSVDTTQWSHSATLPPPTPTPGVPDIDGNSTPGAIANTTICLNLHVVCCAGVYRLDFQQDLANRYLDGVGFIRPQLRINGGAWTNFETTGRSGEMNAQYLQGGTPNATSVHYNNYQRYISLGQGDHTLCARQVYLTHPTGINNGGIELGISTFSASRPRLRCC